ncbi:MAG: bifunctional enoyl-CoA hydratase/phosphate acetyltransferase [Kineosporiaceae bacterium]|nr:bifunctional enoyl-CoA hydratase/phosphate acetyltransferase [Kineosporiaceae bacterium]MBK8077664.1 bifunctional enoyl-CoA hydratase/phosphate acetyltransferase [Kineosporiaceae bacterium]
MEQITNRTFDELQVGESSTLSRTLTQRDIELFAVMSGDVNPMHLDVVYAQSDLFHRVIAHGMWGGALVSTVLGTALPGPGTIYLGQTLRFHKPVYIGDTVVVTVTVAEKVPDGHRVVLDCSVVNQRADVVISGNATVIAPTEKVSRPRMTLPDVELFERGRRYRELVEHTEGLEPLRTAVVHPVEALSLLAGVEAARERLIVPVFVGPEAKIRQAARDASVDLTEFEVVDVPHSDAAAARAVAMARAGEVRAVMKSGLHPDELLHPVLDPVRGLRTKRRVSHVYAMEVPRHPRPLLITDAGINVAPTLQDKRDIVQNAIDLAHALGIELPRVAILAAVETVSPTIASTLDAAALCKMADRGQITGGVLDGPLAFDNAVTDDVRDRLGPQTPGNGSAVAGHADVLVVPDLETGTMLVQQLVSLADADAAGIVLGAKVPIILTTGSDSTLARLGSCAMAMLVDRHTRQRAR